MPLPSQNDRTPELGRAYVLKSNKTRRGPSLSLAWILGAAGVIALAVGGYLLFGSQPPKSAQGATGDTKLTSNPSKPQTPAHTPGGSPKAPKVETPSPRVEKNNAPAPRSLLDDLANRTKTPASPPATPPVVLNQGAPDPGGIRPATPLDPSNSGTPTPGGGDEKTNRSSSTEPGGLKPTTPDFTDLDSPTKPNRSPDSPGNTPSGTPDRNATPSVPPSQPLSSSGSTRAVKEKIDSGDAALAKNELVKARALFSEALTNPEVSGLDADFLRSKLSAINDELVFSPKVIAGDPMAESYSVQSGDNLTKIAKSNALAVDWRFIQRLNKLSNPGAIRVGQKLKLVRGPFHAIVTKKDFRLDLYAGPPDEPERWLFIRSFKVGLGTDNGTPIGTFVVKNNSKLVDPHWVNPKTGEKFANSDPKNPIGERWIGLEGLGESAVHTGYGIHGTIDPDSVGKQMSMGCVRMLADDVALVYEVLMEKASVVKIVP
jgi:hypothetical protein